MRLVLDDSYETGIRDLYRVGWASEPACLLLSAYGCADVWTFDRPGRRFTGLYCPPDSSRQRAVQPPGVTIVTRPLHQVRAIVTGSDPLVIDNKGAETYLINLRSGQRSLVARGRPALTAACTAPIETIALGGHDRITLLGWPGGRVLGELAGHNDGVRDMAFSPDGRSLVSVGGESEDEQHRDAIRLWDVRSRRELLSWMWHHLGAVGFHPQGQVIAVGCMMPGAIKLWDTVGDTIDTVDGVDLGAVSALCFSPDGSCLCTGNRAGRLMIFEVSDYS